MARLAQIPTPSPSEPCETSAGSPGQRFNATSSRQPTATVCPLCISYYAPLSHGSVARLLPCQPAHPAFLRPGGPGFASASLSGISRPLFFVCVHSICVCVFPSLPLTAVIARPLQPASPAKAMRRLSGERTGAVEAVLSPQDRCRPGLPLPSTALFGDSSTRAVAEPPAWEHGLGELSPPWCSSHRPA